MSATALTLIGRTGWAAILTVLILALGGCASIRISEPTLAPAPEAARTWDAERAATAARERAERHRTFISEGIPVEYVSRTNPWPPTQVDIETGGRLYATRCAGCHGESGNGDGDAGRDLTLPPAVLAAMVDEPRSVDQYFLWSISEGGLRSGSEMPAFKTRLTDRQIWQIVTYMRTGFPPVADVAG